MPSRLSDADIEAIAARAAELVLASDELREMVAEETRAQRRREGRRTQSAASTATRASKRAGERRVQAEAQAEQRQQQENERAEKLVQMWEEGVPRAEIAEAVGLTRQAFQSEIYRLRDAGHKLMFRPGVD